MAASVSTLLPPLGHAGRWTTDALGRAVVLHGVNLVNKLPPYHPSAMGFDSEHASFLAKEGFNTVRLGIIWKGLEPEPGAYDERYLDQIAETVSLLGAYGIVVLLDFHQDMCNERFNGQGFPDWAVLDDGLRARPDVGFPGNYLVMRALWRAYDHFWANDFVGGVPIQDRYAEAWRHVAARFAGDEHVLGYDIFNEPFPGSSAIRCARPGGCRKFDRLLTEFTRRTCRAIRQADPRKLVFYEPNVLFDYGADTHHGPTNDPATGFSFHAYCIAEPPNVGGPLPRVPRGMRERICERQERRVFELAERQSRRHGEALLLSEFGATDDTRTIERVVGLADRAMVSWQYWAYFNRDPSADRPEEGMVHDLGSPPVAPNVKEDKLDVLARAYPRAVAGTPEHFGFDRGARSFELAYSSAGAGGEIPPGAETEVFLPERHFGAGYRVEATGARVVSSANERLLRLVRDEGAERVELRVTAVP